MADFFPCFEKTLLLEGGYKLHTVKGDRGGMTYAGIARNYHPDWSGWKLIDAGQEENLTEQVRTFYRKNYWNKIKGDEIQNQTVAFSIYDFAVNGGVRVASKLAQRVVGSTPDGCIGPATVRAINEMVEDEKDEKIFLLLFSQLKIYRYKNICLNDKRRKGDKVVSNLRFFCGWVNRVERGLGHV